MLILSDLTSISPVRFTGVRGSAICWGTALQAGRSRKVADSIPYGVIGIFDLLTSYGRSLALGSTQT